MRKYPDDLYDVAHSNSVIEHVGGDKEKSRMAKEVQRIAKKHFIQTPNYWFFMEPHYRAIGFQWLPRAAQVWLLKTRNMGCFKRAGSTEEARAILDSVQLLTYKDMKRYFPGSVIWREKVCGLTKSFVAIG
jgi:hypothetical protein